MVGNAQVTLHQGVRRGSHLNAITSNPSQYNDISIKYLHFAKKILI